MPTGEKGSLIGAMLDLGEKRRSGVLSVRAEEVTTHVVFDGGTPIDAIEEGTPGEPLGRMLVRTRVLAADQHAKIIDAMASTLGTDKEQKFGEIAVSLGFLTKEKLEQALKDQVRWKIVRALQRDSAEWSFAEDAARVAASPRHELSLDSIVLDAVRWYSDERRRATTEGRGPFYIALRGEPRAVARRFGMTPEEQSALEAIDGSLTVDDLVAVDSSETGADLSALVVALLLTGVVEILDTPRPARASIAPRSSLRPPGSSQPPPANQRIARTVARLKKAQAALPATRPEERRPQNEREARVFAEQCFQHGVAHLRANRLQQAVPLLRRAFGLMPKNLEYELYAMWTEVRVHREKPTPAQLSALRNIAVAAIRQDPNLAFAYHVLGHVTLLEGSDVLAKRHFQQALRLDPEAIDAERSIRVLKRREAKGTRIPQQVRRSKPPGPPPIPKDASSGHAVARVALKKAGSVEVDARPSVARAHAGAEPSPPPVAASATPAANAASTTNASVDETFVLYAKVQKTLELPPDIVTTPTPGAPMPPLGPTDAKAAKAMSALETPVVAVVPPPAATPSLPTPTQAQTSRHSGADRSPLPDGPSSLTGIARVADADRASPAPGKLPAPPPPAPAKTSRAALYAGAAMTAVVLVAAFAMVGLRANHPPPAPPTPAASHATAPPGPPPTSISTPTPTSTSTPTPTSTSTSTPTPTSPAPSASAMAATTSKEGTVILPKWARERRVYVDGKLFGDGPEKLVIPCGSREIRIGSSGKPKTIEVPCGRTIEW